MCISTKTILSTYPKYGKYVKELERLIRDGALGTFYDTSPCYEQAERIAQLIECKNLLADLRERTKRALYKLDNEELGILSARYSGKRYKAYCSTRTRYRKLKRAEQKLGKALAAEGVTEEAFFSRYADKIGFLGAAASAIKADESARHYKLNKTFASGVYRSSTKL